MAKLNKHKLDIRALAYIFGIFAIVGCASNKDIDPQAQVRVLASYPTGSFLENLEVQPDGRLLFTNYPAKTIELLTPNGKTSTFAKLSAYPISLISTKEGYLVTASGKSLLAGEDPVGSQKLLLLDKTGKQVDQFNVPDAMFLNGMVRLENGTILAADSIAGTIWKVDKETRSISPWLQHESLAPLAGQKKFKPGANGIKLGPDGLVVSNTSRGTLSLVKLKESGSPASEPEQIASVGRIDDFWVREDQSILFTTHEDSIKLLSVDGDISVVATQDLLGNTAIAPYPPNQSSSFVVVTDGGLYFGEKDPAKVVSVTIPSY